MGDPDLPFATDGFREGQRGDRRIGSMAGKIDQEIP
jgi:hypothetical protein